MRRFSTIAFGALLSVPTLALAAEPAPLEVPAKTLPVPTADISPGMQAFIGAPLERYPSELNRGEGFPNRL